jgi:hypothetical protein
MPFPLIRVLDPASEPVSLSVMKNYLRVDIPDDDDLITSLIRIARERAEDMTSRCLLAQQWLFCLDRFPGYWGDNTDGGVFLLHGYRRHSLWIGHHLEISLPRGPMISVDSINYTDTNGVNQLLPPTSYEVDLISDPARIRPLFNGFWPAALYDTNSIKIKFTAGYQQTVTEQVTMPAAAPLSARLSRYLTALSLTSAVDSTTSVPVAGTLAAGGIVTFPSATPGEVLTVTYQTTRIPESFIHAIKLIVGTYYENRAEVVQGNGTFNSFPLPLSAASLLATYDLFPVGYPHG